MMQGPWYYKFWWLIKVSAFLLSCWFIYFHFTKQLAGLEGTLDTIDFLFFHKHQYMVMIILLLACLNWSLEAMKWRFLMKKLEDISFFTAIRSVFNGMTVSFFTPNRSGEFAGRIIYLFPDNRVKGALLSLVGSTAQLLITLQAGLASLFFFLPLFIEMKSGSLLLWRLFILFLFFIVSLAWWKLPRMVRIIDALNIKNSWKEKVHVWDHCSSRDLMKVWSLSFLRYTVFTLQQVLLFRILGFQLPLPEMMGLSAISFLLITCIPSIALGELGIRGSVNIAIFGLAGAPSASIVLVTFSLWCLNLALPAFLGALSVLFLKIKNKAIS